MLNFLNSREQQTVAVNFWNAMILSLFSDEINWKSEAQTDFELLFHFLGSPSTDSQLCCSSSTSRIRLMIFFCLVCVKNNYLSFVCQKKFFPLFFSGPKDRRFFTILGRKVVKIKIREKFYKSTVTVLLTIKKIPLILQYLMGSKNFKILYKF